MRTRKLLYVCIALLYFCCVADYVVAQSITYRMGIDLYYIMFDYTNISTLSGREYNVNDGGVWQVTVRIPFAKLTQGHIPSLLSR